MSLLCQIGPQLEQLHLEKADAEIIQGISLATLRSLSSMLAPIGDEQKVYAFDETTLPLAKKLFAQWDKDGPNERFKSALDIIESIQNKGKLDSAIDTLPSADGDVQLLIARALRYAVDTGVLLGDVMWTRVQDREWWDALMLRGSKTIAEIVCDGLSEIQVREGGKWSSDLHHMFACACERSLDERNRRGLLFALTMRSSMVSDSVSAIQRLLQSEHRARLSEDVVFWRGRLEAVRPYCPDWVKGRIRATLACLNSI